MFTYRDITAKIDKKYFFPVYLLYGEERYIIEELTDRLADAFLGSGEKYGREKISGENSDLEEAVEGLFCGGLFSEKKMLIIEDPPYIIPPARGDNSKKVNPPADREEKDHRVKALMGFMENEQAGKPSNIIIFTAAGVDRRRRLYKLIDQKGAVIECKPLKGDALAEWICRRAEHLGKRIERAAVEKLLNAGNHSLHFLAGEMGKYCTYLSDEEKIITAETVETLFTGDIQGDVFKLADALTEGDPDAARSILALLLRRREKPLLLFFMLVRHYRLLLHAHSLLEEGMPAAEFSSALGVHPYAARKFLRQAGSCKRHVIEDILVLLQGIDLKIKTGRIDPEQALILTLEKINHLQNKADSICSGSK
ncbi:MAG: DNA polymerase III subunit delta [Bacillota bacterium]|nr:DNA polymerase III subunit delta [Bacillota bacterium]